MIDRIYFNTHDCHSHATKSSWHGLEYKQRTQ